MTSKHPDRCLPVARRRMTTAILSTAIVAATLAFSAPTKVSAVVSDDDWLGIVNTYRAQSGLGAITENSAWSAGTKNHSCWMMLNGIAHDEIPGTPGYTTSGDESGNSSNVAVSSTPNATVRSHIELWMSGPFHAIGVLRPSLRQSSFGLCTNPPNPTNTPWRSAATLDVVRGNDWNAAKSSVPILFPGNGATTSLTRFIAESPDPRSFCGWEAQKVGLPLIAMMPADVTVASASLNGPNGPVPTCVLHRANTNGTASALLGGDNAVVILPNAPLATGTYSVALTSNGGNVNWSFKVDPNAPLQVTPPPPLPSTSALAADMPFQPVTPFRFADSRGNLSVSRLPANTQVRLKMAGQRGLPTNITAISANFTAVGASAAGYFAASNCAEAVPSFSTLNYEANDGVPNQAIIPLNRGDICLFSSEATDIIIDVNGYVSSTATQIFVPVTPKRLYDSRSIRQPLRPGQVVRVDVEGGASPAPDAASAVAINLTAVLPDQTGWIRAYPCGLADSAVSTLNPRVDRARANSAIVPTAADGTICLVSNVSTDVLIDITGWFGESSGQDFLPIRPIRLADTRQTHPDLNGGAGPVRLEPGRQFRIQIAGNRGIAANARAASLNLVALAADSPGFLVVVPCGQPSDVSNLNFNGDRGAVANGTTVKLDSSGAVCLTTSTAAHVLVDITGVWR